MNIVECVGARIQYIRKFRMIRQDELANKCGITRQYLSLIEHGKRVPHLGILTRIATYLNCELVCTLVMRDSPLTGEGQVGISLDAPSGPSDASKAGQAPKDAVGVSVATEGSPAAQDGG